MTSQMKSMRTLTREWLILPDQYDRFTRYLRDNGLTTATRLLLGIIVIGLGVCALLNRFSCRSDKHDCAVLQYCCRDLVLRSRSLMVGLRPHKASLVRFRGLLRHRGHDLRRWRFLPARTIAHLCHFCSGRHLHRLLPQPEVADRAHSFFASCDRGGCAANSVRAGSRSSLGVSKVLVVITALVVCAFISQIVLTMLSMDASSSDLDPLTGLLNRRGLDRHVEKVLEGFQRQESAALLVIAIDIDRFKTINDVHGHDVGDRIILRVSQRLSAWAHADAVVARIGGDEFILVQRLSVPAIGPMLNSIGPAMHSNTDEIPSTSSVGIAVRTHKFVAGEDRAAAFTDMQKVADSAMYESKRLGGGRVHTIVTTAGR